MYKALAFGHDCGHVMCKSISFLLPLSPSDENAMAQAQRRRARRSALLLASLAQCEALECASGSYTTLRLGSGRSLKLQHSTWQAAGTGGFVWHAGKVLCDWLRDREGFAGSSVLELGCGTGACGLFAAGLGASRVMLTDSGPDALLELAERNAASNAAAYPGTDVCVRRYAWGDELPAPIASGRWDWVLAADVLYSRRAHEPFCATARELLRPAAGAAAQPPPRPPGLVLAHQQRLGDPTLDDFCATAEASAV